MKKWILVLLLNAFILTLCTAVLADTAYDPWAAQKEALKAAGRETEVVLAGWDCWKGNTPWASVMLVRAGDTAQLTVLEIGEDGKWTIVACSDTIPFVFITDAAIEGSWDTAWPDTEGTGYFSLTMEQLIPAKAYGEKTVYQAYRTLSFTRTEQGKWTLCGACDIPFEDARDGYCPYHLLWLTKDGWLYKFYEEIIDKNGRPIDRSEEIQHKTVSTEEMMPYTELSAFDYPAFLSVLHAQAPTEYEHAPVATMPPRPTVAPANLPAGDSPEFVYYNTNGGKYYHADACCPHVDPTYWPLSPVSIEKINNDKGYSRLLPCSVCGAPERTRTDGEYTESQPWVTVENLREHADYVWNIGDETAAYTAQKDFFPIVLSPEEAYAALTRAYEEQGEAGTAAYLQALGIGCAPNGRPVMHAMEADGPIQIVAFTGWGWGEEGSLLFMERTSVWYLIMSP